MLDTRPEETINVLELSPDGTIERYFVDTLCGRWYCPTAR